MPARYLTTRQVGDQIGEGEWTVRRIADDLSPPIERFGQKRMIPADRVAEIEAKARERRTSGGAS
jgi:hypothetical protein